MTLARQGKRNWLGLADSPRSKNRNPILGSTCINTKGFRLLKTDVVDFQNMGL